MCFKVTVDRDSADNGKYKSIHNFGQDKSMTINTKYQSLVLDHFDLSENLYSGVIVLMKEKTKGK